MSNAADPDRRSRKTAGTAPPSDRAPRTDKTATLRRELAMAEAACSDAERRYDALLEGLADATIVVDANGAVLEANAATLDIVRRRRSDLIGEDLRELIPAPDCVDALLRRTKNGDAIDGLETSISRSDGSSRDVVISARARLTAGGRYAGFQSTIRKSTKCAAHDALSKSEEMYRSIFEESQDVVYITSCDGGLLDISPSASQLFGYPKDELLEMDVRNLYAFPEDRRRFQKQVEQAGAVRAFPVRLRNREGSIRHCLLTSTARRDDGGEIIGYHGIMRDVTDQRRADRARERERAALRVIAEASVRAEGVHDLCSRILDGLRSTYRFDFGTVRLYDESTRTLEVVAAIGFDPKVARHVATQSIDDPTTTAALVARTGIVIFAPRADEHVISSTHGDRLKLLGIKALISNPIVDQNGDFVGVVQLGSRRPTELGPEDEAVFLTVAELIAAVIGRAGALEEKEEMHAQLLQAQKMEAVGTLASGVAHDFNNILTAIQGFADLALMSVDHEQPLAEDLDKIRSSAERGARLVRQLLTFSRRQPVEFGPVDLNTATQGLTRMLAPLIGEDISMSVVLERDVWSVTADEAGMQQVIMNLAVNARDAMPDGGTLTLRTENVALSEDDCRAMTGARPGSFVRLSVIDTGTGMDEETVARVFEPFFSTKGPAKGTGLGLSVVYGIVQQHRGWICVDSEQGKGTTFGVYLPAAAETSEERGADARASSREAGAGERILVVEDERTVRDLATRALKQSGYEVLEASSVGDALDVIDREDGRLDLVFSDVVLPDKSGVQLAQTLSFSRPDIPVLLSSGHTDERAQYDAIREGEIPFLPKPYTLPDLLSAVKKAVDTT